MTNSRTRATLRITQVVFDLEGGGLETLVASLVTRFAGGAAQVSVITLGGRVGRVGAEIRKMTDQYLVLRPLSGLSMVAPVTLVRAIRRTRPDVVHLHSGAWYKPALAARLARVPRVIYTEHGREHFDPPLMRLLDRTAARWTNVVAAVSDRLARYLTDVVGIDATRIRTVPNGVDADRFVPGPAPAELRASLGIAPGALVIGSIGRLEHVKAYERLIEAYARVWRQSTGGVPVHLVICGDGSARADLERQVAGLGVADTVRLPGWTNRPVDYYRLFDVFALTSRSEGASVSLMEAMACGAVPVVTDVGANAELLGPELAGQVVEQEDLRALTHVLDRTVRESSRRADLAARARRRVLERYTLDGMVTAYEQLYRGDTPAAPAPAARSGARIHPA